MVYSHFICSEKQQLNQEVSYCVFVVVCIRMLSIIKGSIKVFRGITDPGKGLPGVLCWEVFVHWAAVVKILVEPLAQLLQMSRSCQLLLGFCAHVFTSVFAHGCCLVSLLFAVMWKVQEVTSEALNLESLSA